MKRGSLVLVAAAALLWTTAAVGVECPSGKGLSLPVPNSDWIVEQSVKACGFGIAGPLEISALNTKTRERVSIVAVDDYSHTTVSTDASGNLVITTPNLAIISDEVHEFGGVKVVYHYLNDDPQDRAMWRRYWRNREDLEAKRWVCTIIAGKRPEPDRQFWAKAVGCSE
jgi:hypothetical protein